MPRRAVGRELDVGPVDRGAAADAARAGGADTVAWIVHPHLGPFLLRPLTLKPLPGCSPRGPICFRSKDIIYLYIYISIDVDIDTYTYTYRYR